MGRRMKKVENHWIRGSTNFHSKNVGEPIEYSRCLPLPSVAYAENFNGGYWFRVIWWLFAFDVRCLWRHNL